MLEWRPIDDQLPPKDGRKKFKIYYPKDHPDPEKAGKLYKPANKDMVVVNNEVIFFYFFGEKYYPSLHPLSDITGNYDVMWIN